MPAAAGEPLARGRRSPGFGAPYHDWNKRVAAQCYVPARFAGHGSALAQCHNHMIMPLANGRDKRTQVQWGIRDFESRFGRRPEGMWLPECAADDESLDALAEHGITFTILSPNQAKRVRALDGSGWQDVKRL